MAVSSSQSKTVSRLKKTPRKPLFAVIAIVLPISLMLMLVELLLSLLLPIQTVGISQAYMYDDQLGYRLKPGAHSQLTDHLQEIQVNQLGTVNYQESFVSYERLIFALGDSFTQGTGNPPDVAYPFQLDLVLNRDADGHYQRQYGVVNLGLAAYGGKQSLLVLKRYSTLIGAPDVVLYVGSENDAHDDELFASGYRHGHLVEGNPRRRWLQLPSRLFESSQLFQRIKIALSKLRRSNILSRDTRPVASDQASVAELQWPVIQQIQEICCTNGATLIVSWASGEMSYNWLKQEAKNHGIAFADWYSRADSVRSNIAGLALENAHSGGHYRAWVNRIIAEEFARQIRIAQLSKTAGHTR